MYWNHTTIFKQLLSVNKSEILPAICSSVNCSVCNNITVFSSDESNSTSNYAIAEDLNEGK